MTAYDPWTPQECVCETILDRVSRGHPEGQHGRKRAASYRCPSCDRAGDIIIDEHGRLTRKVGPAFEDTTPNARTQVSLVEANN